MAANDNNHQKTIAHDQCPKCLGTYVFAQEKECLIAHFEHSFSENPNYAPIDILRHILQNNVIEQYEWLMHSGKTGNLLAELVADDCVRCELLLSCIYSSSAKSFSFLLENDFLSEKYSLWAEYHYCDIHNCSVSDVIHSPGSRYDDFLRLVKEHKEMEATYDIKDPGMM